MQPSEYEQYGVLYTPPDVIAMIVGNPPISGSGPPKSMDERRADGLRTEIARIRTALERIEVLAHDAARDNLNLEP